VKATGHDDERHWESGFTIFSFWKLAFVTPTISAES
jgi:hypothetical protein